MFDKFLKQLQSALSKLSKFKIINSALIIFLITTIGFFLKFIFDFIHFSQIRNILDFHGIDSFFTSIQPNQFQHKMYIFLFAVFLIGLYILRYIIIHLIKEDIYKSVPVFFYYSSFANTIFFLLTILLILSLIFVIFFTKRAFILSLMISTGIVVITIIILIVFFLQYRSIHKCTNEKISNYDFFHFFRKVYFKILTRIFVPLLFYLLIMFLVLLFLQQNFKNETFELNHYLKIIVGVWLLFVIIDLVIKLFQKLKISLNITIQSDKTVLYEKTLLKKLKNITDSNVHSIVSITNCKKVDTNYLFKNKYTKFKVKLQFLSEINNLIFFTKTLNGSVFFKSIQRKSKPYIDNKKISMMIISIIAVFIPLIYFSMITSYRHTYLEIKYNKKDYLVITKFKNSLIAKEIENNTQLQCKLSDKYVLIDINEKSIIFQKSVELDKSKFRKP